MLIWYFDIPLFPITPSHAFGFSTPWFLLLVKHNIVLLEVLSDHRFLFLQTLLHTKRTTGQSARDVFWQYFPPFAWCVISRTLWVLLYAAKPSVLQNPDGLNSSDWYSDIYCCSLSLSRLLNFRILLCKIFNSQLWELLESSL